MRFCQAVLEWRAFNYTLLLHWDCDILKQYQHANDFINYNQKINNCKLKVFELFTLSYEKDVQRTCFVGNGELPELCLKSNSNTFLRTINILRSILVYFTFKIRHKQQSRGAKSGCFKTLLYSSSPILFAQKQHRVEAHHLVATNYVCLGTIGSGRE